MGGVSFDGNSLQTDNIVTAQIGYNGMPDKKLSIFEVAHGNRSKVAYSGFSGRKIVLSGTIKADSIEEFDQLLDDFKGYLTGTEKYLDIEHGASTRRYIATLTGDDIPREGGLMYSEFNLQFTCSLPFGVDVTPTSLANVVGATTSPSTTELTIGGNAEYQYPIITLNLVTATNTSNATIYISNTNNGQVCGITRNWSPGDTVVITPAEQLVEVNGIEVEFTGAIPIFSKGLGGVSISDTFDTRTYDYEVEQFRYWM